MDLNCGLAIEELCSSLQLLIDIAVMTVRVINKCIVSFILVSFIVDNSKVKTFFKIARNYQLLLGISLIIYFHRELYRGCLRQRTELRFPLFS